MIILLIRTESINENKILLNCKAKIAIQSSSLNCERVDNGHHQMKTGRCKRNQNPGKNQCFDKYSLQVMKHSKSLACVASYLYLDFITANR